MYTMHRKNNNNHTFYSPFPLMKIHVLNCDGWSEIANVRILEHYYRHQHIWLHIGKILMNTCLNLKKQIIK